MFDTTQSAVVEIADHNLQRWLINELPKLKSAVFNAAKPLRRGGAADNLLVGRAFRYINLELLIRESDG